MRTARKVARGPSAASVDAGKYLSKNPGASAGELAKRFKIAVSTVRRADWWKKRAKVQA